MNSVKAVRVRRKLAILHGKKGNSPPPTTALVLSADIFTVTKIQVVIKRSRSSCDW
jgi:hypothetical protein